MKRCLRVVDVTTAPSQSATAPSHAAALSSANPRSSFAPTRTRGAFDCSRGANLARVRGSMGTTSSAPARDSRGDLRQRAAQQAQQPRYTARPGHANAPQPFQGQQNYAAPRYYGQVRAQRDRGLAEDPPPSRSLPCHAKRAEGRPTLAVSPDAGVRHLHITRDKEKRKKKNKTFGRASSRFSAPRRSHEDAR